LAGHLTKLNGQLRHLLAGSPASLGIEQAESAMAVSGRLRVASDLLVARTGAGSLTRLGSALSQLMAGLGDVPGRLPAHLLPPLTLLADHLGELFTRHDAGEDLDRLGADPRWDAVLAAFLNAGSVLQALDLIEEQMQAWSRRYGEAEISASQDEALRQRWALLRGFGDTLFGQETSLPAAADPVADPARRLAGHHVLLLLDSPFRRAQLRDRLQAAGCFVEIARDAAGLLARAGTSEAPDILLCDNLEPSLHLTTVRAALPNADGQSGPALVLLASSAGSPASLRERARIVGARGTWAEPFRPEDLASILA
jgi:CheY-like chemotaxis protein